MVEKKEATPSVVSDTTLKPTHTKKKKPRKTNVTQYAPLVEQGHWPIIVQHSQSKGRHAVAKEDLSAGTVICQERAATLVVSTPCVSEFCHRCVGSLLKAQLLQQRVSCPACAKTTYCSSACQKADAARHVLECPIVPKLTDIATKHDINVDLLRLTLSLIVRRVLEERRAKMAKEEVTDAPIAPWWCINELALHPQVFDKNWVKCVAAAAQDMSEILPESLAMSAPKLVELACRINTNAHSLSDDDEKTADTAFGLFPMGSLFFKHSCAPNCHFTADRGILTYRTIKPIKAGEELLVSHIELFQPRSTRKQELLNTKQIRCDCSRCRVPLRKSVDRFLDGVLCEKCHVGVYLSESEFPEIAKDAHPVENGASANGSKAEGEQDSKAIDTKSEDVVDDSKTLASKDSEQAVERTEEEKQAAEQEAKAREELLKKECRCDNCGHVKKHIEVEMLRIQVQRDYQQIFQFVQSKNHGATITYFRLFIDRYQKGRLLHPYHVHLVNAHLPLLTAYKTLGDYASCLPIIKHVIDVYESSNIVAPLRHEFVELYAELGMILSALAIANRAEGNGRVHRGGEVLEKRYKRETLEAYRKAYEVCRICLGEQSAKTVELKKKARV
ncbi:hypothetical protein SpCBS45565_g08379 [Spizellomyces sp. 'palustris']|nr:hypothetical protein SpCBS45565_g08379 [Spizellomyces sp. 'palustris']